MKFPEAIGAACVVRKGLGANKGREVYMVQFRRRQADEALCVFSRWAYSPELSLDFEGLRYAEGVISEMVEQIEAGP